MIWCAWARLHEFRQHPDFAQEPDKAHEANLGLYPEKPRGEHAENAWGMAIDLDRCIGCGTCVAACQAENNIPIVGKEQVLRFARDALAAHRPVLRRRRRNDPRIYFQPVPCMHCEKAPCELVCPVGATTHSDEG